jgi:hypothetical protein
MEGSVIRGLVEILLLRKFPKLTLLVVAVAALVGVMRPKRAR